MHVDSTSYKNYTFKTYSIESIPAQIEKLLDLKDHFPKNMRIYLTLIELSQLSQQIEAAQKVQKVGCIPVMHLPARLIKDTDELCSILEQYKSAGISDLLLLGGNPKTPIGSFMSVSELLKTGAFHNKGFKTIAIAGHPEGNAEMEKSFLHTHENFIQILKDKISLIREIGCEPQIVTQFLFDIKTLITWAKELRSNGIDVPIHPGIAGPASIKSLIKFSLLCGVGASINFLKKQALNISQLLIDYNPDNMMQGLVDEMSSYPDTNIGAPHFFVFGGFKKLFTWIEKTSTISTHDSSS